MTINISFNSAGIEQMDGVDFSLSTINIPESQGLSDALAAADQPWSYDLVTATRVEASFGSYTIVGSGTGFGPVSSWSNLSDAIMNGTSTGALTTLSISAPGGPLMSVEFTDTGLEITVGALEITTTGAALTDLNALFDLVSFFTTELSNVPNMTETALDTVVSDLSSWAMESIDVTYNGDNLLSVSTAPTGFDLTIRGFTFSVPAELPVPTSNFGDWARLYADLTNDDGTFANSLLERFSTLTFTAPDDTSVINVVTDAPLISDESNVASHISVDGHRFIDVIVDVSQDDHFQAYYDDGVAVFGLENNDYIEGGSANDLLSGGSGSDELFGWEGDDTIVPGTEDDFVFGGTGTDTVIFNVNLADATVSKTGDYDFVVTSSQGRDELNNVERLLFADGEYSFATSGSVIDGSNASDDTLVGGSLNDTINSGRGEDSIQSGLGEDQVWGMGGNDFIDGGDGADTLRGGRDVDTIFGGDGEDSIVGQRHGDHLSGDYGDDTVKGGGGNDEMYGGYGDDFLKGGTRNDTISGGYGHDKLAGNSGNDYLYGNDGNDTLNGGGGHDVLQGGEGHDWMRGGDGFDGFVFEDSSYGNDTIDDFDASQDSLLILSEYNATASQLVNNAQITDEGVLLELSDESTILLSGLTNTDDLTTVIQVIDIV